jgi:hypothetical protein
MGGYHLFLVTESGHRGHFINNYLLFLETILPWATVTYLILFPPDDLRWDLDLLHVLMQSVSGLFTDNFQKHLSEKENRVSMCRVAPVGTTAESRDR